MAGEALLVAGIVAFIVVLYAATKPSDAERRLEQGNMFYDWIIRPILVLAVFYVAVTTGGMVALVVAAVLAGFIALHLAVNQPWNDMP